MPTRHATDAKYLETMLEPMRESMKYRPAFGRDTGDGEGVSLSAFQAMYGADPLYHWVGLDSDLMYAAHKAAGGMTSIYRQLGIGCERLVREIIKDVLHLSESQVKWSYAYEKEGGKEGVHTLDARIDVSHIADPAAKRRFSAWLAAAGRDLGLGSKRVSELRGTVLEVRQGYKSADSKRQNADLRFGARAANEDYLPAICLVSTQASEPVCRRYRNNQVLVLLGRTDTEENSTFSFFRNAVGYDLKAFFERNTGQLRDEFRIILKALLTPD